MSDIPWTGTPSTARSTALDARAGGQPANLADLLERILDKGIVIVGDIRINLLDIELLTIKLRLLVASVDKAKEMGIDWWEHDPSLSSKARRDDDGAGGTGAAELAEENRRLRERLAALESGDARPPDDRPRLEPAHAEPRQDRQSAKPQARDGQAPDERDPDEQARDESPREERAPRSEPRARDKEQRS
ncbi:gas vesicle protein GvpJ [Actinomadura syzygii]|uniref:gas vesicle protein n=1 Tax=Actinomadura syzygii TaxID=1427538 RepID=UPI001FEA8F01|nr:gas vesicle protein [Actinomadura syzygii]